MNQGLALEIMLSGKSVLLTGPAGAGKTFVLNQCIKLAKYAGKHVSVTATTGLAATHLGGTTIHSWSGIGVYDSIGNNFVDHMAKGRREIIEKTDILIIDEISMMHDFRLDMVDEVCRLVRKNDEPFGGIQIIMSGDFFQLPPINRGDTRAGGFVVNSQVWRELDPVICYLHEQHRQDDEQLLNILNAIRAGDVRRHHAELLLARAEEFPDDLEQLTELHTVNVDVDTMNEAKLETLEGDEVVYSQMTTGSENYVETLQRSVLAPANLKVKKGALVMAVKNSPERKYVNGSIGTIIDFEPYTDYPIVKFKNGKEVSMVPDTWELRDGDKKRASISQIPLRLAWAITIHKSQGMTLDAARMDLRKAFVEGMGYVALSRVKKLNNLYLIGINQMALKVSEEAQTIDAVLRVKAAADAKRFAHLEKKAKERAEAPEQTPATDKKSGWNKKIAKMRQTYPNAYRPWESDQDELLKQEFQQGLNIAALSKLLGRHEGSIKMRLQKHFGDDVVQE
ncbi:MAG: ATP-dependent endonuclease [Candidatus Microsaccharimonas sossegonensis]|uniref:ATP-dependent endonuclease n=1 Tax=Candidatus Microsaccharimonas sossegonensis TaxID=2506948 RepID=A0A4Q0AI01_9BACT|nr:MAG: ATP-dependent endonuclease [Candidatus Microsaccharimonas sossegonensis]